MHNMTARLEVRMTPVKLEKIKKKVQRIAKKRKFNQSIYLNEIIDKDLTSKE